VIPDSHRRPASERGTSDRLRPQSGRLGSGSGRWAPPRWVPSEDVVEFDDDGFEAEVLGSALPVVLDFWAETCVPCRLQEPTIERLGALLRGRARVGRLNVYDNPRTPEAYEIKGVPHLLVVVRGEVVLELVGDHSFEQLEGYVLPVIEDAA